MFKTIVFLKLPCTCTVTTDFQRFFADRVTRQLGWGILRILTAGVRKCVRGGVLANGRYIRSRNMFPFGGEGHGPFYKSAHVQLRGCTLSAVPARAAAGTTVRTAAVTRESSVNYERQHTLKKIWKSCEKH